MLEKWDGDGRVALGFYHWLDVWGTMENGEAAALQQSVSVPRADWLTARMPWDGRDASAARVQTQGQE